MWVQFLTIYDDIETLQKKFENRFFGQNRDFLHFLMIHDSADKSAGHGRNHYWWPEMHSPDDLDAFSYPSQQCMTSRSHSMSF